MNGNYRLYRMFEPEWNQPGIETHDIECDCGIITNRTQCKEVISNDAMMIVGHEHIEYSYYCPECGAWLRTDQVLKEQGNENDN